MADLSDVERACIWLSVGDCFFYEQRSAIGRIDTALAVLKEDEIVRHIVQEHVAYEAMNYKNKNIRTMTGE